MEEIKKIEVQGQQYGVADMLMRSVMGGNAQVIAWSHTHNMNDYKDAGTYRIKGERTGNPMTDNLPIMNQGNGHTIEGILYVLDSSLTNGSGNSDDCTITQFLMLSNRVGGQEGDMYMRSAYGANKDSLTWKPWEKYQTNVEVGAVTDGFTVNPQDMTRLTETGGMNSLIDSGIYSGVYIGPKALLGTPSIGDTVEVDPITVETFVMIAINNYAGAKDAKCITQIKFAVTNGGVFSMEKRSTTPGTTHSWSPWESIGGNDSHVEYRDGNVVLGTGVSGFSPAVIGGSTKIGKGANIGIESSIYDRIRIGTINPSGGLSIKGNPGNIQIGNGTTIGEDCHMTEGVSVEYSFGNLTITSSTNRAADDIGSRITTTGSDFIFYYGWMEGPAESEGKYYAETVINAELGYIRFFSSEGHKSIELVDGGLNISKEGQPSITIGKNVTIPDNLSFSIADNILTITDGTNTWKLTAE